MPAGPARPRPSSYNVLATSEGAVRRPFYSASSNFVVAPEPPLQTHAHEDGYDSSDWFDPPDGHDDSNWRTAVINDDAREGSFLT